MIRKGELSKRDIRFTSLHCYSIIVIVVDIVSYYLTKHLS